MRADPSYVFLALAVVLACRQSPPRPDAPQEPRSTASFAPGAATDKPPEAPVVLATASDDQLPPAPLLAAPAPEAAPSTAPAPAADTKPKAKRVLVIGDSLSDPRVHGGGFLQPLARCPDVRVENVAKGGYMVNQMRRRFETEVLPTLTPDFTDVIVFGGVNDLYSDETAGRNFEKISADLSRIYAAARAHKLRVIALTVTPWGGFSKYYNERRGRATRRLNDWIRAQATTGAVDVVVDAAPLLACGNPERLCPEYEPPFHDGIHFGRLGHQRLGARLLEAAFPSCRP